MMIKDSKGLVIVIIIALMITMAFAVGINKTISVELDSVNLEVNGERMQAETILYEHVTYVPLRAAVEMHDKEVKWNESTKTVNINDKKFGNIITGENTKELLSEKKDLITKEYDVIVIGTDPEGISAAVAAARDGATTLLIDTRDEVGGLFTLGWLNFLDMNYSPNRVLLTQGIFKEFFNQVEGIAFDIQTAKRIFNKMITDEPNLNLVLNAEDIQIEHTDQHINSITYSLENEFYLSNASIFIDSTQDGNIAASAGVPYTLGHQDTGGPAKGMAVTQVFKLSGVDHKDWSKIRKYLQNDGDKYSGSTSNTAWGFKSLHKNYKTKNEDTHLRGLNIARQKDKSLVINALQVFQIDPLNPTDIERAKTLAAKEIDHIIPYLRKNVPGMEGVSLLAIAPELYIRESRHFETEYILTIDDVLENRFYDDQIAIGSYPVDVQSTSPDFPGNVIGNPSMYSIPLRSIIPRNVDNLLIANRCAGYSSLAFGSARVVPIGMSVGEAAGSLATLCVNENIMPSDVSQSDELTTELQTKLKNKGAYLPDFDLTPKLVDNEYYESLQLLRRYGLIAGGYDNNYRLEDDATIWFYNSVVPVLQSERKWNITVKLLPPYPSTIDLDALENSFSEEKALLKHLKQQPVWTRNEFNHPISRGDICQLLYEVDNYFNSNR
ncbi:MAG: FAD-dependent oxidoreductase [Clostridia bacterium]